MHHVPSNTDSMNADNRGVSFPVVATLIAAGSLLCLGAGGGGASPSTANAFPDQALPTEFVSNGPAWTDSSCGNCHEIDPVFSHPLGIRPAHLVPDELVLDRGVMTCATCHDTSDPASHDLAMAFGGTMLRLPAETLCLSCHTKSDASAAGAHTGVTNRAHTRWPSDDNDIQASSSLGGLDAFSQQCLSCHDGLIASDPTAHIQPRLSRARFPTSHPIGMEYPTSIRDAHWMMLHDRDSRDSRIRLFNGAVGCGSCHTVYSTNDDLLVVEKAGSRLCLACHDL